MSENNLYFEFGQGGIRAWLDGGIHIKAVTDDVHLDPVEISEEEALDLARALESLVASSRKGH